VRNGIEATLVGHRNRGCSTFAVAIHYPDNSVGGLYVTP
jgi:hypothetical protein